MSSSGPENSTMQEESQYTNSPVLIASPAGKFVSSPRSGRSRFQVGHAEQTPANAERRVKRCTII